MTQVLPRTRVKHIQIIPDKGLLTVLRMSGGQVPFWCNSTNLALKAVALLSVYHGKVSRGHHKILHNYQRTEHPENNLFFLKVT